MLQVAEKFLERDELASMSFQNDFLTPFVVVMRQSGAKEIRELIIRQASRMVLSRVNNIKSGWKSMFMVTHYYMSLRFLLSGPRRFRTCSMCCS